MKKIKFTTLLCCCLFLSACSTLFGPGQQNTVSSSLMDFLYPEPESRQQHSPQQPHLALPLRVGIAFVPPAHRSERQLPQQTQMALLDKVKAQFNDLDYVQHIELIPSHYLKPGGGFDSLDQLSRLYDIDVIGLVSYDQVTRSQENNAALLYWTIAGMYLIPGNENTTQTFVDTVVFDIDDRALLFRAPGLSKLEKRSTAVGIQDTFSKQQRAGFEQAMAEMTLNLQSELSRFEERVQSKDEGVAVVTHKSGYSSGSLGTWLLVLVIAVLIRRLSKLQNLS